MNFMHNHATWTDDRVTMLKKLWGDGLSASQIAAELGGWPASSPDGGRNAVIGKAHRLGLAGRVKNPPVRVPKPPRPRSQSKVVTLKPKQHYKEAAVPSGVETLESRSRLKPATGFVSSRERRLRGLTDTDGDSMFPDDMTVEDRRFFRQHLYAY